jgi:hypothetical protein
MKPRPKTGEKRDVRQPLKIDKLPPYVHDAILATRADGKTWTEIEALSREFVKWEELPMPTLELFPGMYLPHSNLQRWYDLRVEQVSKEVAIESERAREFSKAIAKVGDMQTLGDAAVNALGDVVFSVMRARSRDEYSKALQDLGYLAAKLTDAKAKKVRADAEAKRIQILEREIEEKRKAADKATNEAATKLEKGKAITITDINRIRERVFGLPALQPAAGNPA